MTSLDMGLCPNSERLKISKPKVNTWQFELDVEVEGAHIHRPIHSTSETGKQRVEFGIFRVEQFQEMTSVYD